LTESSLLQEVDLTTLVTICNIKVGEALKIKKVANQYPKAETRSEEVNVIIIVAKQFKSVPEKETFTIDQHANTSHDVSSPFAFEERKNRMFFRDFQLPMKFSASVALALETKTLMGNLRHEFVRDICTHISSNGVYFLNKLERNLVATAIVTKYPFLKDPIGSGLGSWEEAIKNRFKHVRKYDAKKRKLINSDTTTPTKAAPPVKRTKKSDFWNEAPNYINENEVFLDEHIAELEKQCSRPPSHQDTGKIKLLMAQTFEYRRKEILTTLVPVKDILAKYPPLATAMGIRHEFCRVLKDDNAVQEIKERFTKYKSAVVQYCKKLPRKSQFVKSLLSSLQEATTKELVSVDNIESMFVLMVLPELLQLKNRKTQSSLVEILSVSIIAI
ncbi:Hypothetical predicted protein, partial [Paramuricea clavata]